MPKTINKTSETQIIGGTFSNRENADKAVKALQDLGVSQSNIHVLVQLNERQAKDANTDMLSDRGFSESQARYYDKVVREGKILVTVYEVTDPAPIIDIFDKHKAEYNPSGSRNLRDDVAGMTVGAAVGAAAGGVAGAVIGGPVGAAVGATAGAVVGGGSGAAAGKAAEHKK
jgi:outer membrane lipoprotein SlyB